MTEFIQYWYPLISWAILRNKPGELGTRWKEFIRLPKHKGRKNQEQWVKDWKISTVYTPQVVRIRKGTHWEWVEDRRWYCSRVHCSLNLQICCSSLCLDISISNYRFMHERNENTKCCSDVSDEETPHTFSTTATAENHYGLNLKKRFICGSGLLMVLISASSRYIQKWWRTYLKKPSLSMCAAHDSNPSLTQQPAQYSARPQNSHKTQ